MDEIRKELEGIVAKLKGRNLSPADVIAYAKRNTNGAIYQWLSAKGAFDEKEAQKRFALILARDLIRRVKVTIIQADVEAPPIRVRAFVSLEQDRKDAGGYRTLDSVMTRESLRNDYLRTAIHEFEALQRKYQHLKELAKVWDAVCALKESLSQAG